MSDPQFPPLPARQSSKSCANCGARMSLYDLPGHYGAQLEVDVCLGCKAIWFDQWEGSQLSPDGVVGLFQLIHERGGTPSSAGPRLSEGLRCVSCGEAMTRVNDRVKNTRFVYQSCRHGHGRFTTFHNFLSEKQFVRELTLAERHQLGATVRQVRCSGCGAPVDLTKQDACAYCRAPVSVFDREAARKAIDHYLQERRKQVPAQRPAMDHRPAPGCPERWDTWDRLLAADLAADLLFALGRAATRGLARPGAAIAESIDAGPAAASATDLPGGLLDSLPQGTPGGALGGPAGNPATGALDDALGGAGNSLSSATEALFGSMDAAELFPLAPGGVGEVASSAAEGLSHVDGEVAGALGESIGELASGAAEGVVDLVSDGLSSLLTSIFD